MLMPALHSARLAGVRCERQLDLLQCIEAIRLYAATHDGAFPPSLEAITEAPVPLDPATGKPFEYKAEGATATLTAPCLPVPDNPAFMFRYKLELVHNAAKPRRGGMSRGVSPWRAERYTASPFSAQ